MTANIQYCENIETFLKNNPNNGRNYLFFVTAKTQSEMIDLKNYNMNFIGAVFSEIIYEDRLYDEGILVIELNDLLETMLIKNIDTIEFSEKEFDDCKSIITIVEGISKYNDVFLEKLFSSVDINTNIIGGGAGFIQNEKAVIFDQDEFYFDGAILIKVKSEINIGVQHGCEYLAGPFVATSCDGNVLKQLDYNNALNTYKEIVKNDSGKELNEENIFEITQHYPLGIVKYNSEQIVRDAIALKDGNIVLAGDIKENAVINILKVNKDGMLNASKKASSQMYDENSNLVMLFDCASRVSFLGESFQEELDNVFKVADKNTIFGAVTIGEIANSGNRYINFYNKTCVIGSSCI